MLKKNTVEGHLQKNEVVLEPGCISDAFMLSKPKFYKVVTTVTRDYESPNIYNVLVGQCNIKTSVDESKYKGIHQNALTFPGVSLSKKRNRVRYQKKRKFTCILFLVHLPYSINK